MFEGRDEVRLGADLAARAYLYSLFHMVFSGVCSAELVSKLFGEQTLNLFHQACGWLPSKSSLAKGVVGLDFGLGKSERTLQECIDEFVACADANKETALNESEDSTALSELCEVLKSDYAKLFQVPGEMYVYPWESPYVNVEGTLFQASTLDVRSYYHQAGFKLQAEQHFPDDHIAAMLDYLGRMGQRAYDAFADGEDTVCSELLAKQQEFMQKHVLTWVDVFVDRVIERDMRAYYSAFAGAVAVLVYADKALLADLMA